MQEHIDKRRKLRDTIDEATKPFGFPNNPRCGGTDRYPIILDYDLRFE